jgi:uncharacterized protein (TIGR04222 family)
MTTIAADTWGISGPRFLLYFAAAAVAALILSALLRRVMYGGSIRDGWEPNPEQLAYFAGGPSQAVLAALAGLRAEGSVSSAGGKLALTGRIRPAPTALTWAVYQAAERGVRARGLENDRTLKPALADLRGVLVSQGWLLSPARRLAIGTIGSLPVLAVLAVGIARINAGIANNKPVGLLIALTAAVGLASLVLLFGVGTQSRAAQRRLTAMQLRYAHLSPQSNPAMATYGAAGAAMAVALFGAFALWSFDPAFASDVNAMASGTGGGGSSSGDSGSGCSSGSSCGGGGCGGGGCGG